MCIRDSNDTWSTDRSFKEAMSQRLHPLFDEPARAAFHNHKNLAWTGITKWPGTRGEVVPHRDPSFVDERRFRSLGVWCALEDLTLACGPLVVRPGSHHGAPTVRPHQLPDNVWAGDGPAEHVPEQPIELKSGSALIYDHALVHGSGANSTSTPRTVIAGLLVPDTATPTYTIATTSREAITVGIDPTFFVEHKLDQLDVESGLALSLIHISEPTKPY